jgi:hypothetical protein
MPTQAWLGGARCGLVSTRTRQNSNCAIRFRTAIHCGLNSALPCRSAGTENAYRIYDCGSRLTKANRVRPQPLHPPPMLGACPAWLGARIA